ncbi:MAG: HAD family hydrolase [Candidatus Latescibacterota bacterium]|jgi:phosphoglycolate phosphatase-like HAD superfamily hydrolase
MRKPCLILGQRLEVYNPDLVRGRFRHALFDFDGTLSLIRAGWQEVMVAQCADELARTPTTEDRDRLETVCREFITRLTGKQTIYQMIRLAEEVERRGGQARPPLEYKREYLARLHDRIGYRLDALRSGRDPAERYLVGGSVDLLEGLTQRGVTCYLASGTDEEYVQDEARLLGLASYFDGGIYGARDDYLSFSKKMLMERIVADHGLRGEELLAFGDGYVEIENAKQVGGAAIGVASCELGTGSWDPWKRHRLLEVGADLLTPDWREAENLLAWLFAEEGPP